MNREANLVRRGDKAAKNFKEYLEFVIRIKPAAHQQEWLEACQDIGDKASGQRYCIIAPPGAGKSVFIGVGFLSWIIGRNPELHYGMLSYADQVAWDRAKPIRDVIEKSSPFNYAFPDTVPDLTSWDRRGFRVQREDLADPHPTLRAGGISSAVVSYRLNGLVLDDVLDVKTAATAKSRKKAYDDYVNAVSTRMVRHAWQLCIGTRWSDDDFIGELLRLKHHGAPVWTAIHVPAILPNGRSYWPEQYQLNEGEDNLMEKKNNFPQLFSIQYQGDTTGGETQMITKVATYHEYKKDQNGRPHAEWVKEKDLLMGASWDTALKDGQENDYSVMYIGGLDKHGNIWVIDREKDRFTISEIVRLSKKAYMDWQTYNIWFEDSAVGTPAVTTIREEMPQVPCDTVYYGGGKRSRANVLAQYLHNGQVRFPAMAPWFPDMEYYLKHFPYVDHDDDIDSLFILVDNLLTLQHPAGYADRPRVGLDMR
jgi:predicted phage terminase large subunit-like protein